VWGSTVWGSRAEARMECTKRRLNGSRAHLMYDSTFSRTVWRLYGGAKGLVMWYYKMCERRSEWLSSRPRRGGRVVGAPVHRDEVPSRRVRPQPALDAPGDGSDRHFRKTAPGYDRRPGIKWLSCTAKWQSDIALDVPRAPVRVVVVARRVDALVGGVHCPGAGSHRS
jgi:hypothetical protein